jgi:clan AA aspartic protease
VIAGTVKAGREAAIDLRVRGTAAQEQVVEATIDTGFTGFLTLPMALIAALRPPRLGWSRARLADGTEVLLDVYAVEVNWDGAWCTVRANAVDTGALVGMGLLAGYRFCLDAVAGGRVVIEPLP